MSNPLSPWPGSRPVPSCKRSWSSGREKQRNGGLQKTPKGAVLTLPLKGVLPRWAASCNRPATHPGVQVQCLSHLRLQSLAPSTLGPEGGLPDHLRNSSIPTKSHLLHLKSAPSSVPPLSHLDDCHHPLAGLPAPALLPILQEVFQRLKAVPASSPSLTFHHS